MSKTEFQKKIEKSPQGALIAFCDQRHLDHTGGREALIAKLVAYEEAKATESEPEPVVEPPATEPEPETPPAAEPTELPSED
ncbi:unnamed protein product [marine sediment metagenome]|uniref:SAP domain-containing protein n=1 Tax=marine sediment metagenome TaxID=412755 RepID=X1SWH7_9ZZZZ